ncbi:hypothetical protein JOB18_044637 [Solea senegalensis]|uniref:GDNF/GAS1 domain-containing protein n=1 Tax=Solea senegalensis TaxID=28829 RepID=A0AAV6RLA9_SOLSE|nr:hypothetical protein JOB18_044637 [Solea senegalensis]
MQCDARRCKQALSHSHEEFTGLCQHNFSNCSRELRKSFIGGQQNDVNEEPQNGKSSAEQGGKSTLPLIILIKIFMSANF